MAPSAHILDAEQLFRDLGDRPGEAIALQNLGILQRETGDYPAAAASHRQALAQFQESGRRVLEAEALNRLGVLSSRTSATEQAREYHGQALAITRELGVPLEEARVLEGIGQRIGAADAKRVKETFREHALPGTSA